MKPDIEPAGKQVDAEIREEMANLRAELDDFIHHVPTLSQTELNQAKDKLIQKFGSTNKGTGSLFTASAHKKMRPDKIVHSVILATVAAVGYKILSEHNHYHRHCSQIDTQEDCDFPCCWCKSYTSGSGGLIAGKCYNPKKEDCYSTEGNVCNPQ